MELITKGKQEIINIIQKDIFEAIDILFSRIKSKSKERIIIEDKKNPEEREGVMQDCEFGMMLYWGYDWLCTRMNLSNTALNKEDVEDFLIKLVRKTVLRVSCHEIEEDFGGDDPDSVVFFSGKPYTLYEKFDRNVFSANLDSAMLITGFLAIALNSYNEKLKLEKIPNDSAKSPKYPEWVRSLRDAAIFVCLEGMKYIEKCKWEENGKFAGFTCAPSKDEEERKKNDLPVFDRLFFTWTTCETINDLRKWRFYIESLEDYLPLKEILEKINGLESYLVDASNWAFTTFYDKFKQIKAPFDIKEFVSKKSVDFNLSDKLATYVQYVYHLSQYGAIRSLTPNLLTLGEIKEVITKLNNLVLDDIINSEFDASTEPSIFRTLTRRYSLGASREGKKYDDDAYYPLVIVSLAGIINRSMEFFPVNDLSDIIENVETSLREHYQNLRIRKPIDTEDEKLWAFAKDKPFMIYATQRTIYAMIIYKDLLEKLLKNESTGVQKPEDILRDELAKSIANTLLGPGIIKCLSDFALSIKSKETKQVEQTVSIVQIEPPWLSAIIQNWLNESIDDFKISNVVAFIESSVSTLKDLWTFCSNNPKPESDNQAAKKITKYHKLHSIIFNLKKIGPKLNEIYESKNWNDDNLKSLLFEYLFYGYIYGADKEERSSIKESMEANKMVLWDQLDTQRDYQKQKGGG